MPGDVLARQPLEQEEEILPTATSSRADSRVAADLESEIKAQQGGGRPLAEESRAYFEPRLGVDLSAVRVHANTRAVNARAFTVGRDVFFAAGQYGPETREGRKLLAHELTHVVQQSQPPSWPIVMQRMRYGTGDPPSDWVRNYNARIAPANERSRVSEAIAMIEDVVNDQPSYPRCHDFFHQRCPGGATDSLSQMFNKAVLWKGDRPSALAFADVNGDDVAYTQSGYRSVGKVGTSMFLCFANSVNN